MDKIVRREPAPIHKTVAFTGYRLQKMPFGFNEDCDQCKDFKRRLFNSIEMLIIEGYTHFISGGALGMDMFAAEAVLELRKRYPNITLEIAIPFDGQTNKWEQEYKNRAEIIRQEADVVTWVSHQYTSGCMFVRNRYMVDNSSILMAAFDGQPGGTAMTVDYARRQSKQITIIRPALDKGT